MIAPIPDNESQRLAGLRHYQILDSETEQDFDDLAKLASQLCGTPIALVSLVDANRQWFKAKVGIAATETPRDIAFCAHAIHHTEIFEVPDAAQDSRFADNPLVTTDPHIRFYAGVPLINSQGYALGTLCVIDRVPKQLTDAQKDMLRILGRQAITRIKLRRQASALEHALAQQDHSARQLHISHDWLTSAQALAHIGNWDWDLRTGHHAWSDELFRIFGYEPQAITPTSNTIRDAVHPDDRPIMYPLIESALSANRTYEVECRIFRPSGDLRIILCRGMVHRDTDGKPTLLAGTIQDITERKQQAASLDEANRRLQLATTTGGIGVWEYAIRDNQLVWDDQMRRLYGYGPENFPGAYEAWTQRLHPEDRAQAEQALQDAIAGRRPFDTEFRLLLPDNIIRHVKATALVVHDAQGTPDRMIGVNYDVTASKQAENALREQESRLRAIVDYAVDGIITINERGLIESFNPAAERLFGYAAAEMIGQNVKRLMPDPYQSEHDGYLAHYRQTGQAKIIGSGREVVGRRKDGSIFPLELGVSELRLRDRRLFTGIVRDITERKQAEERFRLVVESAPNGMLMVNDRGVIDLVNAQIEQQFGYGRAELLGQPIELLIPERFRPHHPGLRNAFFAEPATRAMGAGRDLFGRRKDGSEFPVEHGLNPIDTPTGLHVLASVVDITARKQAEEQLQHAAAEMESRNRQLAHANELALAATKAKSAFLASMSHEIRTPMNAIVGMADLLQETALSPAQREYVHRFSRAASSLMDLINDILDISKIEAGHVELESIPFDIHDLVDKVGELMAIRANAKALELVAFVHPDTPSWVAGDPLRLRQVFVNLLGNAIKFTDQGEVVLRIEPSQPAPGEVALRIEPDHNDPQTIRCSVSDTGIGIPAEKLETIFENFTQLDSSTTREYGGTGLGLSISKQLVALMGGDLRVDSRPGHGSTFSFAIRLAPAPALVPETAPPLAINGCRILIVDDNETNRLIVREHLRRFGASLDEATNGLDALRAIEEAQQQHAPFSLIILDYHMPGMSGLDLAEAIRARPESRALPLLFTTSELRGLTERRAQALGILSTVYKPISRTRLLDGVAVAMGQVGPTLSAPPTPLPAPLKPLRILLVEDLEDNRDVVSLFLNGTPYQLESAENGLLGLQAFQGQSFDLVFMDMQMPVMDGYQATAAMRQWERERQRRPTPIISLTANAYQEDVDKSLAAGCTGHLSKPIKKQALLDAIRVYTNPPLEQAV